MDSSLTNNKMVQNVIREGLKLLGTNRVAGFGQEILNLGADQFGYGVFGGCVRGCLRQWFELDWTVFKWDAHGFHQVTRHIDFLWWN